MDQEKPYFTVVIPTYNRAGFIADTLQSVFAQTYSSFEVLVVDDGSTDETEAVVGSLNDRRLHYWKKENAERGAARNYGIQRAKGQYITFLDSDDLFYAHHLQTAYDFIQNNNYPEIFHLGYEMKTADGQVLSRVTNRKGDLNRSLLKGNSLSCIGVFVQHAVMQANLFEEDRRMAGSEDWELWVRMASRYTIAYSNAVTACMIHHDSRSVITINEEKLITRILLAASRLQADEPFMARYGKQLPLVLAHLYLYIALHLAMSNNKKQTRAWLVKAWRTWPPTALSRKTAAIIRKLL